jgi:hypothetical protein
MGDSRDERAGVRIHPHRQSHEKNSHISNAYPPQEHPAFPFQAAVADEPDESRHQAAQPEKVRIYVGQKDLMCHRYLAYDKAGTEIMDMQMTNIKVNAVLDPALFKYTPPAGANVMDMTKGMPNMGDMMKNMPPATDAP